MKKYTLINGQKFILQDFGICLFYLQERCTGHRPIYNEQNELIDEEQYYCYDVKTKDDYIIFTIDDIENKYLIFKKFLDKYFEDEYIEINEK